MAPAGGCGAVRGLWVLLVVPALARVALALTEQYPTLSLLKQRQGPAGGCASAGEWAEQYSAESGESEGCCRRDRPQPRLPKGGLYRKAGEELFTRACSDRRKGDGFKLQEGRFRLDIWKKFSPMRVVKHWNRLPREVVDASSLELLKARLDAALSNLG
uniref:Uncharacterized protein n=1 Tax=Calidris pygmaea TaxID=425635 RepID=A0A8C3KH05_9CHAR